MIPNDLKINQPRIHILTHTGEKPFIFNISILFLHIILSCLGIFKFRFKYFITNMLHVQNVNISSSEIFLLNIHVENHRRENSSIVIYRPVIESSPYIVVNSDLINETNSVTPNSKEYRSLVQSVTTYYIIVMKIYIPIQALL